MTASFRTAGREPEIRFALRSKEATQTYLRRGAVGNNMRVELAKELRIAARKGAKMPSIRRDFLSETLGGQAGYVYYNGAHYVWFDPKRTKQEAGPVASPHSRPSARSAFEAVTETVTRQSGNLIRPEMES